MINVIRMTGIKKRNHDMVTDGGVTKVIVALQTKDQIKKRTWYGLKARALLLSGNVKVHCVTQDDVLRTEIRKLLLQHVIVIYYDNDKEYRGS